MSAQKQKALLLQGLKDAIYALNRVPNFNTGLPCPEAAPHARYWKGGLNSYSLLSRLDRLVKEVSPE